MPWIFGAVLIALASFLAGQAAPGDLPPFLYTSAARYEPGAWNQGKDRFPDGARLVLATPQGRRPLVPEFFSSADAAVSYDGKSVLFSGRRSSRDHWQIWQVELAGGAARQVAVVNTDDCIRPFPLPDGRIVYTRVGGTGSAIEVVSADGGKADVLTHVPGRYLTSDVLRDGRILYESRGELFTVYPDGTGVETLRCDHGPMRSGAKQVKSGDVIFSVEGGLARYRSALEVQENALKPTELELAGPVAEDQEGRWLVAARRRSGGPFGVYRGVEPVELLEGANAVEPVVVTERVAPRDFPSARVPSRTNGNLLCLDARESKDPVKGVIHSVRLYTQDATGAAQVLGQTPVAADGSFYVEVPADRPIRMELLDAAGTRLRAEEHWFWMRPSEQRICVGCHAGPERAPENKVPEILNQMLTPVKMLEDRGPTR